MLKKRQHYLKLLQSDFEIVPICALLGPRQCGKTTLAHQFINTVDVPVHYFDLEDPIDLIRLDNPKLTLEALDGLIVMDEIQRKPNLFPYLRVLVDKRPVKLLLLGSASPLLLKQSSESLAGRIAYTEVTPFDVTEIEEWKKLWLRGGFPRSYLASSDQASFRWLQVYTQTYFQYDLAALGIQLPPQRITKLWAFLAQYHGNILNYAEISRFLDLSLPTTKNYLHFLEGTFMIRMLGPWHENISKRQVKSPKMYIRDSGIFHQLTQIKGLEELMLSKSMGASWEGFALEQILKLFQVPPTEAYFWATHQEAEIDLFLPYHNNGRIGFEFKCSEHPRITKSMIQAITSLQLKKLYIVTPLDDVFYLREDIQVVSLQHLAREFGSLVR